MNEEKKDVRLGDSQLIGEQTVRFVDVVAPYMTVQQNISDLLNKESLDFLKGLHFFRLCSCTTEKVDNMSLYLQEQFSKLFTAIYPLNRPVVFGIVSRKGRSSLVIGFQAASDKGIVSQLMNGLLSGIELEDYSYDFGNGTDQSVRTGYISTVPVTRIDNEKQTIDLSTLMRCLNGKEYTVFVFAKPVAEKIIHAKYTDLLEIRDICSSICKRNVMYQKNQGNSLADSESVTRKGILQEVFNQALRDRKFDGKSLVDSLVDGGISSESSSTVTTEGTTEGTSFDVQNGLALELTEYCSKAIERMKYGLNIGMWDMTVAYSAPDEMSMNVLQSCLSGELAKPVTDSLPLRRFSCDDEIGNCIQLPIIADHNPLLVPVTSRELGLICTPPSNIAPDFELREGKIYPLIPSTGAITVGSVCDGSKVLLDMPFGLSEKDLNKHTFVCGITGSGKTNTVKTILRRAGKPFMVIECAKKEYRNLRIEDPDVDCEDAKHNADIVTYTLGKPEIHCLQINPFFVQRGISLQTHIDFLKDLFNASFSFYGPMPYILERCLYNIYRKKGWNVTLGYHPKLVNLKKGIDVFDANYMADRYNIYSCKYLFPTMQDLKNEVKHYIDTEMKYDSEVGGNIKTAMNARLESLCVGAKGFMFNTNNMPDMAAMLNEKVVFELEGLADDSDKAFCVGLFVIMINEYRQVFKEEHLRDDVGLQHLLVIEEAHRLLKNIDTERSSENLGNPKGKAVEHFTNMIAEMRSYGQGVIIAEQIPGKLAPDVIKNSSNKLVHRVVSSDDQALVASTIGMKEDEAVYLGNLKTGHALCHKEGMSLPVHVLADFVEDNIVSDHDLLPNDMEDIFKAINIQMVSENLSDILDKWALRLLNSILACSTECIVSDIKKTKDNLDRELRVGQVELLPVRNHYEMLGEVIASRLLPLLCMGVYSFGDLPDNELCKSITELCKKGLPTNVDSIQKQLEKRYNRKPQNHCALVISELIKSRSIQNVDYEGTIQEYFVDCVPEKVRKEIIDKCMGGKCVN